jgi:hypothetical protein
LARDVHYHYQDSESSVHQAVPSFGEAKNSRWLIGFEIEGLHLLTPDHISNINETPREKGLFKWIQA